MSFVPHEDDGDWLIAYSGLVEMDPEVVAADALTLFRADIMARWLG